MKRILILSICLSLTCFCQAQVLQEWFNQNKTQIKYLVEQIAAFETYSGYVKKGYNIANDGLGAIRNLKKGDFDLHSEYFNSLKLVNPAIKRYSRVAEIISMQAYILKASRGAMKAARDSHFLTEDEINYLSQVHQNLLTESNVDMDQLLQLVSDGSLQMKDDERIRRIDELYTGVKDKYTFIQSFSGGVSVLMLQRNQEQEEVKNQKRIHGIQ